MIESDDWGSIRMPNKKSYEKILRSGIAIDKCGYNKYDSLESDADLDAIYNSLSLIRDKNGRNPVITANTIVANPDFNKMKENNYDYYFESFVDSYKRIHGSEKVLNIIKQGIVEKMFFPQLHGREHIYLDNWMNSLKAGDFETVTAFNNQVYGLSTTFSTIKRKSFLTALDGDSINDFFEHQEILKNAQLIFTKEFGYASKSFIAPNYTWHPKHEEFLKEIGVDILQGGRAQKVPGERNVYGTIKHQMGEINSLQQIYLIRNTSFEPSIKQDINWYEKIIKEVKIAFMVGAPVVLSTHRVNFMGGIEESNRTKNLELFVSILTKIIEMYPNIEFLNSVELGLYIKDIKNEF